MVDSGKHTAYHQWADFSIKNANGLWQKHGQTLSATINGCEALQADIAPVLVEMLAEWDGDESVIDVVIDEGRVCETKQPRQVA